MAVYLFHVKQETLKLSSQMKYKIRIEVNYNNTVVVVIVMVDYSLPNVLW